ncbi:uncharacterized protein F4812DRAFT_445583 [Daldinia caldariorum]|uniref:uncharacterized protein n=1 Tax=Daldinia caldariorum TaxID=326644 RepID=UPI002007DF93|nr:uncharacterized protein F4812DRAFT_445583 [Daldinia caldariorum]KAI1463831.1 hypothetical protein F4812DRAFT_445583 [Daldinia caldariorum]
MKGWNPFKATPGAVPDTNNYDPYSKPFPPIIRPPYPTAYELTPNHPPPPTRFPPDAISENPTNRPFYPTIVSPDYHPRPHYFHWDVLPDQAIHPDPTRPLSPLARRSGVSDFPHNALHHPDRQTHSGLATLFPSVLTPGLVDPIPRPDNEVLHRIFRTEREQANALLIGIKAMRLPPLNSKLVGGFPSDEDLSKSHWNQWESFKTRLVVVDESRWLSCFRKDNWCDSRLNVLNSLSNPIPGVDMWPDETWYTVDNPVIWGFVSQALEISSRILRLMCEEQDAWLDAMFCTEPIPIGSIATYDFPAQVRDRKTKLVPRPKEQRASPEELFQAIEDRTKNNIIHTFADETTLTVGAHAVTHKNPIFPRRSLITYYVPSCLRALLEMETTVPERCMMLIKFVNLILHEFMHAANNSLVDVKAPSVDEPFFDDEWIAELGQSFDRRVWGGALQPGPVRAYVRRRHRGFGVNLMLVTFPSLQYAGNPNTVDNKMADKFRRGTSLSYLFATPPVWASAVLCEEFWTTIIPRRGSIALRPPLLFGSAVFKGYKLECRLIGNPQFMTPELRADYEAVRTRWAHASAQMMCARAPWYKDAHEHWRLLPWSNTGLITAIDKFIYFHANRNLADCREVSGKLVLMAAPTVQTQTGNKPTKEAALSFLIGFLMVISLPINPGDLVKPNVPRAAWYYPSNEAAPALIAEGVENRIGPHDVNQGKPPTIVRRHKWASSYQDLLKAFIGIYEFVEHSIGAPLEWLTRIVGCFGQLHVERTSNPNPESWGSFTFRTPPYEPGWVTAPAYRQSFLIPLENRYRAVVPWTEAKLPAPTPTHPDSPYMLPKNFPDVYRRRRPIGYAAQVSPLKRNYPKHLYIGDVANHRALNDAWVVEMDGADGFNVFDITSELRNVRATESDYSAMVVTGPQGPMLTQDLRANVVRVKLNTSIEPIGKLILPRRIEELAECNGQNGRPAWTSWGSLIFDVTNFPARSSEEREALSESYGGSLSQNLIRTEDETKHLLERLNPYSCAFLHIPRPTRHMRYFTQNTLRWYDNPSYGIYMALGGGVYDISEYLHFHPGGSRLFIHCTGRDATHQFTQYHNPEILNSYGFMQVGYLVPEYTWEELQENHVVVHDWVFDISSLQQEDPSLFVFLQKYTRQDTAAAVAGHDDDATALIKLFLEKESLIVGSLARNNLLDIPVGEFLRYNDYESLQGAWVAVDGYIYNVGSAFTLFKLFLTKSSILEHAYRY